AGNLYGTTLGAQSTGTGSVFKLSPESGGLHWRLATLHRFCQKANCIDGAMPASGLTYAGAAAGLPYDGSSPLFGTTMWGANPYAWAGVVYQLTPATDRTLWRYRVIHGFCREQNCADGFLPSSGIVADA